MAILFVAAFFASLLTFFTGFGLTTLLLPTMAIFLPLEVAIIGTAMAHFVSNLTKITLLWRKIVWHVALPFGIAACLIAPIGAWVLSLLVSVKPIATYLLFDRPHEVTWLNIAIGSIMMLLSLTRTAWLWALFPPSRRGMIAAGVCSGFFGGISGYQGAFRSAFLIRLLLLTSEFVATGSIISAGVDAMRLTTYALLLPSVWVSESGWIAAAAVGAILGAVVGRVVVHRVTMPFLRQALTLLLALFGIAIATGLLG